MTDNLEEIDLLEWYTKQGRSSASHFSSEIPFVRRKFPEAPRQLIVDTVMAYRRQKSREQQARRPGINLSMIVNTPWSAAGLSHLLTDLKKGRSHEH